MSITKEQADASGLPGPGLLIEPGATAIVITDQNDFLSSKGVSWGTGANVEADGTVGRIEALFAAARNIWHRGARVALAATVLTLSGSALAQDRFSAYVQPDGTIELPAEFRTWQHLGTWSILAEDGKGAGEMHVVYASPGTVEAYWATGAFPDGAVLVKELLATDTNDMTTGTVSRQTGVKGWFVMIKDSEGRFPNNPLWGSGWGWSLFPPDDPSTTVTTDYEADCIGCHVPAEATDWVYVQGYPVLHE